MEKASIRIAGAFYCDARDFLYRFETGMEAWSGWRSERVKWCVDLRFAFETSLKSIIAWSMNCDDFPAVYERVTSGRHDLVKLADAAHDGLKELGLTQPKTLDDLACLPVDLRYNLDATLFRDYFEESYYRTFGNDGWLDESAREAARITTAIGDRLGAHSKIVNARDVPLSLEPEPISRRQMSWIKKVEECMRHKGNAQ